MSKMIILSRKMYVLQPFPAFQYPFWPFPARKWLFEQEKRLQKCATFYCMLSTPNQASFDIKTFVNNFAGVGAPKLLYCLHYYIQATPDHSTKLQTVINLPPKAGSFFADFIYG